MKFYHEDFASGEMFALEIKCGYFLIDIHRDTKFENTTFVPDLCLRD